MKNKYTQDWKYEGPYEAVFRNGREEYIDSVRLETQANSRKQAVNHFKAQIRAQKGYGHNTDVALCGGDDCFSMKLTHYGKKCQEIEELRKAEEEAEMQQFCKNYGLEYSEEWGQTMVRTEGGFLVELD